MGLFTQASLAGIKVNDKQTGQSTHDLRHKAAKIMTIICAIQAMIVRLDMHHTPSVHSAMNDFHKGAIDPDHCCI